MIFYPSFRSIENIIKCSHDCFKIAFSFFINDFINKSTPTYKRKSITTDSKGGYDTIMRDLGFTYHQEYTFHLLQRINDLINEQVNEFKKQYKTKLKESNPNYSQHKINKSM